MALLSAIEIMWRVSTICSSYELWAHQVQADLLQKMALVNSTAGLEIRELSAFTNL